MIERIANRFIKYLLHRYTSFHVTAEFGDGIIADIKIPRALHGLSRAKIRESRERDRDMNKAAARAQG